MELKELTFADLIAIREEMFELKKYYEGEDDQNRIEEAEERIRLIGLRIIEIIQQIFNGS
ncbi:unnamed protein product [marine sediment metagenome]|uniref:Uncharacterized protein n=1 Tax=marine sediment metagenome TaxID=412755 RepID=X1B195_9ZZZZ